jgi:deoxyhypusine synthase
MIKAYEPYLLGSFRMDDASLHRKETNRLGNILIPNERYVLLEEKLQPIFKELEKRSPVSPSEFAAEMGKRIEDGNSFLAQAYKRKVPVFSPGITDSAIGLQTYFAKQKYKEFAIDVTKDMKALADLVLNSEKTAAIILGGGISKHHTIGVNLLRGGLDYALYVSTSDAYDGSLSGAPPREAVSWGKIAEEANYAHVHADAAIAFPLIWHAAK